MKSLDLKTEKGKATALEALAGRKQKALKEKRVNNSSLYAGSPMYYYCGLCGLLADVLGEGHMGRPREHCSDCEAMLAAGFSLKQGVFAEWESVRCPECGGSGISGYDHRKRRPAVCSLCDGTRKVMQEIPPRVATMISK